MKKFLVLCVCLTSLAHAEKWNENNNPNHYKKIIGMNVITSYQLLPMSGKLDDERLGWSETYWPSNKGGIAFRWNSPDPMPFNYSFHTKEQLQTLPRAEMEKLSPAELYDISQGDYTYSLTRKTLGLFTPHDLWWEGICHGWSQAAVNYPEPAKVLIKNPDGIIVPFGSSDVKGLLAMHDAYNSKGTYTHIGGRCSAPGKVPGEGSTRDRHVDMPAPELAETEECRDVNAGAFHVVMANMIGIQSMALIADVDRFNDVWNQPVVSYDASVKEELAVSEEQTMNGIARRLSMQMKMVYGEELQFASAAATARGEDNFVSKNPVTRTGHQEFRFKIYEYILELDGAGKVVGGEWMSDTRPDFLWTKKRDQKFQNSPMPLGGLVKIYKPVKY
ncbi:MAG: hypothetical protein H0V66_01375 [Bdellovibrionales bacterium]|nr:hypothetical protein [Bdellovibrionales bacterium]